MKNKKLKVAIWVIVCLLTVAYLLCYIFAKEQTTFYTECVIDFINKPLPIVGVSLAVILIFIYKTVIENRVGQKKINECKEEAKKAQQTVIEYKNLIDEEVKNVKECVIKAVDTSTDAKNIVKSACELSHNIKIKALAQERISDFQQHVEQGEEIDE